MKYTLVQHSGYGYGDNPEFQNAVESVSIQSGQLGAVARAGGLIFNSYAEAADAEEKENFSGNVEDVDMVGKTMKAILEARDEANGN